MGIKFNNTYEDLVKWINLYGQQGVFISGAGIDDIIFKEDIERLKSDIDNINFNEDNNLVLFTIQDTEEHTYQYMLSLI